VKNYGDRFTDSINITTLPIMYPVKLSPEVVMSEQIMIRLSEVTKEASIDQLKYWCKLLKIKPKIISRAAHITDSEASLINEMVKLIQAGKKPREAAESLSDKAVTVSPQVKNNNDEVMGKRIDALEKAVLAMANQVQKLTKENRALRLAILPTTQKTKIVPWFPKPVKKIKCSWYKKLWLELFSPEILRAQ